jgi:SAM-dependent methyltransferase
MSLLDVGAGPGTITRDFARLLAPGRVVGIDRDPGVVAQAAAADAMRSLSFDPDLSTSSSSADDVPHLTFAATPAASSRAGAVPSLVFDVADVYDLPYPSGTFDVVHAHQVLQHLSDPVAALREMARVTAPGGLIAARDSDYAAIAWYPPSKGMETWRGIYRAVAQANGAEPDAGRHLLAWAHAAGFADVTASASTWCFADPADREWWGDLWADRTVQTAYGRQAVVLGLTDEAGLAAIAEAWRNWAADEDGWIVIVAGEILVRVPGGPPRGGYGPGSLDHARQPDALAGVGGGGATLAPGGPAPDAMVGEDPQR